MRGTASSNAVCRPSIRRRGVNNRRGNGASEIHFQFGNEVEGTRFVESEDGDGGGRKFKASRANTGADIV